MISGYGPSSLHDTIFRRVANLFVPFSLDRSGLDIPLAVQTLKRTCARKYDSMRVLKTWVNSWFTSTRMHEATKLPYLFGCQDGVDNLSHYVMCPHLFTILTKLRDAPACPAMRLGLRAPTRDNLLAVACTFSGYHAVKRSPFVQSLSPTPLNSEQRVAALRLFADAFFVSALEVGLSCKSCRTRHFSFDD